MKSNKKQVSPIKYILLSLILVSASLFALNELLPSTVSTRISLQFEGIEDGKNPDDTRFDYNILISDEILEILFQTIGTHYDEAFASSFEVAPVLPNNIVNTIEKKRIAGEDYTYFPNEFQITVTPDASIGLDEATCVKLMDAYPVSFETFFKVNYTFPFMNLENLSDEIDFTKYDYPEYQIVFENKYDIILSYLYTLERDDPEFVSSKGYNFSDLQEALRLSEDLDVKKMTSLVNSYNLSKNSQLLRFKYLYMIRRYELEKNKVYSEYEINQALLNIVQNNKLTLLLPGINGETMTYSQVNDSYDSIASQVTNSLVDSSNYDKEIAYLNMKLTELDTPLYSAISLNAAKNEATSLGNDLKTKLDQWIQTVSETANEYFDYKYSNAISVTSATRVNGFLSLKLLVILGLIIWVVVFTMLIQRAYSKYNKYNKSKNIELNS